LDHNIRTIGKFANRLNQRIPVDTRLPRAKIPVVHLTIFAKSSLRQRRSGRAISARHWQIYPVALEMTFSERSFK